MAVVADWINSLANDWISGKQTAAVTGRGVWHRTATEQELIDPALKDEASALSTQYNELLAASDYYVGVLEGLKALTGTQEYEANKDKYDKEYENAWKSLEITEDALQQARQELVTKYKVTVDTNPSYRLADYSATLSEEAKDDSTTKYGDIEVSFTEKDIVYNLGCVKTAYLSPLASYNNEMNIIASNSPTAINDFTKLWSVSGAQKGMLAVFVNTADKTQKFSVTDQFLKDGGEDIIKSRTQRYGFQFHYNPGSVDMVYSGTPGVDPGYILSGQDKFNPFGAEVTQSSISIQLVINRVADSANFVVPSGNLSNGHLTWANFKGGEAAANDLYAGSRSFGKKPDSDTRATLLDELTEIYKKGTMYDVEYLLATFLGTKFQTEYRGVTSDVGWLMSKPTVLTLSESLTYVGFVNQMGVRHVMFNQRMVPIFTTVSLTFNRVPDYKGITSTSSTGDLRETGTNRTSNTTGNGNYYGDSRETGGAR